MSHDVTASPKSKSPFDHPTYGEGMNYLDKGQWQKAIAAIEALQQLYPDNVDVRDLLAEITLRATVAQAQPRKKARGSARRMVRVVMIGVLMLIVCSIIGLVAFKVWIEPTFLHEYRIRQLTEMRQAADEAIIGGRYTEARQTLEEMRIILPEDADIDESLQRVGQLEKMSALYNEAQKQMAAEEWATAIETLTALQSLDAHYRDLAEMLATAHEAQALDEQFQSAEADFANGEWANAIATYEQVHQTNLTFKFETIQTRLFDSHLNYARELIASANTDSNQVTTALSHLSEALMVRPVDQAALDERRLAETYFTAITTDERDQAIDLLQAIYAERPDYAGNAAVELLYTNLVTRADANLAAGQTEIALSDYQAAADLFVADSSEAQDKLAELNADSN